MTAWLNGFVGMELSGAFRLGGEVDRAFEFGIASLTGALTLRRWAASGRRLPFQLAGTNIGSG